MDIELDMIAGCKPLDKLNRSEITTPVSLPLMSSNKAAGVLGSVISYNNAGRSSAEKVFIRLEEEDKVINQSECKPQ